MRLCRRIALRLQVLTCVCTLAVLACEAPDSPDSEPSYSQVDPATEAPIIEAAPWFELPKDWSEQHPSLSPNAQLEAHFMALAEREAVAHPGDGGGRAWLERVDPIAPGSVADEAGWRAGTEGLERPAVRAASAHRFEVIYEAGEQGVSIGGVVFLSPEIFWEWSRAQTVDPEGEGYVTAEVLRGSATLRPDESGTGFLVLGEPLEAGDRVRFVYGAGRPGARVDRYAERGAEILVFVDADGDGYRRILRDTPRLDVLPHAARSLVAHGPAEVAPGEPIAIRIALVDGQGNRTRIIGAGNPRASEGPAGARVEVRALPTSSLEIGGVGLRPIDRWQDGTTTLDLQAPTGEGVLRLRIEGRGPLEGLVAEPPPIVVRATARRLVWGDLHGHTTLSDGTGRPRDYFRYAREVAGLDVVALTDHDHWGPRPLDEDPEAQRALFATTDDEERPGRFVTIPGYEWTSWLHGHRHVLWFDPAGSGSTYEIHSAIDPETDRPDELWAALRGQHALTFAHHSAGEPVATNWRFRPDPELEPVTEIASVHGQSESPEMPSAVRGGIPGWFALDVLRAGYRLGFIGSGDSHDGHPGLTEIAGGHGGIAGLFVDRLDREGVRDALRRRQTFATNGIRPFFEVSIDGVAMGGTVVPGAAEATHRLRVRYEATAPIERVELVRSGRVAKVEPSDPLSFDLDREIPALGPGEFHYVRVRQKNGGNAWSSPIFVDSTR